MIIWLRPKLRRNKEKAEAKSVSEGEREEEKDESETERLNARVLLPAFNAQVSFLTQFPFLGKGILDEHGKSEA